MVTAKPYYKGLQKCFIMKTEKSDVKYLTLPWIIGCLYSFFLQWWACIFCYHFLKQWRWMHFAHIFKSSMCLRHIYVLCSPHYFQMFPENPGLSVWEAKVLSQILLAMKVFKKLIIKEWLSCQRIFLLHVIAKSKIHNWN